MLCPGPNPRFALTQIMKSAEAFEYLDEKYSEAVLFSRTCWRTRCHGDYTGRSCSLTSPLVSFLLSTASTPSLERREQELAGAHGSSVAGRPRRPALRGAAGALRRAGVGGADSSVQVQSHEFKPSGGQRLPPITCRQQTLSTAGGHRAESCS